MLGTSNIVKRCLANYAKQSYIFMRNQKFTESETTSLVGLLKFKPGPPTRKASAALGGL